MNGVSAMSTRKRMQMAIILEFVTFDVARFQKTQRPVRSKPTPRLRPHTGESAETHQVTNCTVREAVKSMHGSVSLPQGKLLKKQ